MYLVPCPILSRFFAKGWETTNLNWTFLWSDRFALEKPHAAAAECVPPRLDRLPGPLCRALRQPPYPAPPALLLGRGRLLHPRGMGFLPHRLADPTHHAQQRPPAAAQHLSGVLLEALRLS